MIFEERDPPAGLERAVARIRYLEMPRASAFEKILPQPAVHLILNLSDPYTLFDHSGAATVVDDAFVSGLQSRYLVIGSPPVLRHVAVEFRPDALGSVSSLHGKELADRVRPGREVLPDADALVHRVRGAAATPTQCLDIVSDYLALVGAGWRPDPVVDTAIGALDRDPDVPIGELVVGLPVSHRTMIARFRRATGVTPRDYAQIVRFHRFVTGLAASHGPDDWAGLASHGGYYDQAHIIRAFRRFSGWTPTEYRRRVAQYGADAATFVPLDEVPTVSGLVVRRP